VFPASIPRQAARLTRSRRYGFLTFLFDEEGERVREANLRAMQQAKRRQQPA
jgi:hypothetical protein